MSTGDTGRSQSPVFFNNKSKKGEETSNRTSKRKREEQIPTILVEQASTCTLVNEDANQITSSLQQTPAANEYKEQIALKLNRLKDKVTRYESHKDFLTRCIAEKLIPKGLKLGLEPTIGNFDQEFVDEWYSKLKGFSLKLMNDITYCEKTIEFTNESIKNTETALRNLTENQEFLNIEKILKTYIEATKRQLQQRKFKKFNYLKYKPQPIKEQTPEITQANIKKSYANAVKGNINIIDPKVQHLRKKKQTNILEEPPTLLKKLELLHPAHTQHHRGKSPTRVPSTAKQTSTDRDKEIEDLRNQIKLLKQNQKEHDTQEQPKHTKNKEEYPEPKNIQVASASGGHAQTNIDL